MNIDVHMLTTYFVSVKNFDCLCAFRFHVFCLTYSIKKNNFQKSLHIYIMYLVRLSTLVKVPNVIKSADKFFGLELLSKCNHISCNNIVIILYSKRVLFLNFCQNRSPAFYLFILFIIVLSFSVYYILCGDE